MNHSKKEILGAQISRLRAKFAQCSKLGIDMLPAQSLMQAVLEECGRWRERLYSPLRTLELFIEQVLGDDQSCQKAVARSVSEHTARGNKPGSLNSGPYCKARQRLAVGLVERLCRDVAVNTCADAPAGWLWRGRPVKLVDGTTVSMPDTAANQARFPQNRTQKPGLGFPIARVVAVISLSCGVVLQWAVSPYQGKSSGESSLLWQLAQTFSRGDLVIADCCYAGYFMIASLQSLGVDIVMTQHQRRNTDFDLGQSLGTRDHVVHWRRPSRPAWMDAQTYAAMPQHLTMRETRVGGWTLISTLLEARDVTKDELGQLYRWRWQIELDLRAIKTYMHMDVLRCKSPDMVRKEIAVHLLAYNLVCAIRAQAAHFQELLPRQLRFMATLQLLGATSAYLSYASPDVLVSQCRQFFAGVATLLTLSRPDRVEPRRVKRRRLRYPLLTQPRSKARTQCYQERYHRQHPGC
jgi:hypothetical protein